MSVIYVVMSDGTPLVAFRTFDGALDYLVKDWSDVFEEWYEDDKVWYENKGMLYVMPDLRTYIKHIVLNYRHDGSISIDVIDLKG